MPRGSDCCQKYSRIRKSRWTAGRVISSRHFYRYFPQHLAYIIRCDPYSGNWPLILVCLKRLADFQCWLLVGWCWSCWNCLYRRLEFYRHNWRTWKCLTRHSGKEQPTHYQWKPAAIEYLCNYLQINLNRYRQIGQDGHPDLEVVDDLGWFHHFFLGYHHKFWLISSLTPSWAPNHTSMISTYLASLIASFYWETIIWWSPATDIDLFAADSLQCHYMHAFDNFDLVFDWHCELIHCLLSPPAFPYRFSKASSTPFAPTRPSNSFQNSSFRATKKSTHCCSILRAFAAFDSCLQWE